MSGRIEWAGSRMLVAGVSLAMVAGALFAGGVPVADAAASGKGKKITCPWDGSWNARAIKGKRLKVAERIAARHGCTVRVLYINGKSAGPVTADAISGRINVAIKGPKGKAKRVVKVLAVY